MTSPEAERTSTRSGGASNVAVTQPLRVRATNASRTCALAVIAPDWLVRSARPWTPRSSIGAETVLAARPPRRSVRVIPPDSVSMWTGAATRSIVTCPDRVVTSTGPLRSCTVTGVDRQAPDRSRIGGGVEAVGPRDEQNHRQHRDQRGHREHEQAGGLEQPAGPWPAQALLDPGVGPDALGRRLGPRALRGAWH